MPRSAGRVILDKQAMKALASYLQNSRAGTVDEGGEGNGDSEDEEEEDEEEDEEEIDPSQPADDDAGDQEVREVAAADGMDIDPEEIGLLPKPALLEGKKHLCKWQKLEGADITEQEYDQAYAFSEVAYLQAHLNEGPKNWRNKLKEKKRRSIRLLGERHPRLRRCADDWLAWSIMVERHKNWRKTEVRKQDRYSKPVKTKIRQIEAKYRELVRVMRSTLRVAGFKKPGAVVNKYLKELFRLRCRVREDEDGNLLFLSDRQIEAMNAVLHADDTAREESDEEQEDEEQESEEGEEDEDAVSNAELQEEHEEVEVVEEDEDEDEIAEVDEDEGEVDEDENEVEQEEEEVEESDEDEVQVEEVEEEVVDDYDEDLVPRNNVFDEDSELDNDVGIIESEAESGVDEDGDAEMKDFVELSGDETPSSDGTYQEDPPRAISLDESEEEETDPYGGVKSIEILKRLRKATKAINSLPGSENGFDAAGFDAAGFRRSGQHMTMFPIALLEMLYGAVRYRLMRGTFRRQPDLVNIVETCRMYRISTWKETGDEAYETLRRRAAAIMKARGSDESEGQVLLLLYEEDGKLVDDEAVSFGDRILHTPFVPPDLKAANRAATRVNISFHLDDYNPSFFGLKGNGPLALGFSPQIKREPVNSDDPFSNMSSRNSSPRSSPPTSPSLPQVRNQHVRPKAGLAPGAWRAHTATSFDGDAMDGAFNSGYDPEGQITGEIETAADRELESMAAHPGDADDREHAKADTDDVGLSGPLDIFESSFQ